LTPKRAVNNTDIGIKATTMIVFDVRGQFEKVLYKIQREKNSDLYQKHKKLLIYIIIEIPGIQQISQ